MSAGFLNAPEPTDEAKQLLDEDLADYGFIMNVTRLWARRPNVMTELFGLMRTTISGQALDIRQRGILVAACASAYGDSYCSLAWGAKLAKETDAQTAAGVLMEGDDALTASERAMAAWARKVARDPNGTTQADVQGLRDAGFDDDKIFAITVFVALRMAFSTVNDALGAQPDAEFRATVPEEVLKAVDYGRPISD